MKINRGAIRLSLGRAWLPLAPGLLALGLLAAVASAQTLRLEITRDTWVSAVDEECTANLGGSDRLKTKGIQEFSLFDIDPAPLRGRVIASATLHLKPISADLQRRLTVSTIAAPWGEGTSSRYRPQVGGASFLWPFGEPGKPWAYPGSDITAVINGNGQTLWRFADATEPDAQGWQSVAVDPAVIAARVAGISHGFVLFDDTGSEYQRDGETFTYHLFPNRFIASREAGRNKAPYLTVRVGAEDRQPPEGVAFQPPRAEELADLRPGEALACWTTPRDRGPAGVIGFLARYAQEGAFEWEKAAEVPQYLVPAAGSAGSLAKLHLRDVALKPGAAIELGVRAVDSAGNLGAVVVQTVQAAPPRPPIALPPAEAFFTQVAPNPHLGEVEVFVIDALDKIHPLTAALIPAHEPAYRQANHLWSAAKKTIRLQAARNEFVAFVVVLAGRAQGVRVELAFAADDGQAAPRARLYRLGHVASERGPLPDPLVPLGDRFDLPDGMEKLEGQQAASILADVYVPHDARPGPRRGKLTLTSGAQTLTLDVELSVWNFTLPDQLSFIPEMNCYSLPAPPLELAYYRLAQENRTCLNRLAYNWRGMVHDGCAPGWDGQTFQWEKWDKRFGPLLDGSAFADLPRGAVPVEAFYLPLNENWPMSIEAGFAGGYWADEALKPAYRATLVEAARQFAQHFQQRQWNQTLAEFFLNGKVYFKKPGWSRCSAPWIFDEPVNTQDFWALRWYGQAFHEGVALAFADAQARPRWPRLVFRCDISRPQWQRDLLDNVIDVNVVGGSFAQYQRLVMERKARWGEVTYNYGSTNAIEEPNTQPALWCVRAWSQGADGVLPWQTVGNAASWKKADPLSLFYPPAPAGPQAPAPSVRLKAYRQGQQLVEYLTIFMQSRSLPRWAVAEMVQRELSLEAPPRQGDADAALKLWRLRMRLGRALDEAHPPARRQWRDPSVPPRDPTATPQLGPAHESLSRE